MSADELKSRQLKHSDFVQICCCFTANFYSASTQFTTQMPCLGYGNCVRPSVRVSVCPSVCHTLRFYENDPSQDHEIFTVSFAKDFVITTSAKFPEIRTVSPRPMALNEREQGKVAIFNQLDRRSLVTVRDRARNHQQELLERFRLLPKFSTLSDLERPYRSLLQKWCVFRSSRSQRRRDPINKRQAYIGKRKCFQGLRFQQLRRQFRDDRNN